METQLEHDPRTKQLIKDALYAYLYLPVEKAMKARLETLIQRNCLVSGYSHRHVVFKNELFNVEGTIPPLPRNRLNAAFRGEMEEYLQDRHQLNSFELPYVLGFINQVLNASCALEDYLTVLPDSVHAPLLTLQATCPYRTSALTAQKADALRQKNIQAVQLMKERMVTNLLI